MMDSQRVAPDVAPQGANLPRCSRPVPRLARRGATMTAPASRALRWFSTLGSQPWPKHKGSPFQPQKWLGKLGSVSTAGFQPAPEPPGWRRYERAADYFAAPLPTTCFPSLRTRKCPKDCALSVVSEGHFRLIFTRKLGTPPANFLPVGNSTHGPKKIFLPVGNWRT